MQEQSAEFSITIEHEHTKKLAITWLTLAISALLASGIFSILLFLSRTPTVSEFIPWKDFFHTALVVHVDLSVFIWFMSFAGLLWTISTSRRLTGLGWLAVILAIIGTIIITISPFTGEGNPLINNYIPILDMPVFLWGLTTAGIGFGIVIIRTIITNLSLKQFTGGELALRFGCYSGAIAAALSLILFIWAWLSLPSMENKVVYYEYLFWGSGHTLQFTHALLMMVVWIWLASVSGANIRLQPTTVIFLLGLCLLPAFAAPVIYHLYDVLSPDSRVNFTTLMKYGHLPLILPGLFVALAILQSGKSDISIRPVKNALIASFILFTAGGIIGFMIEGVNVVIPAHYHGSIVGVTLAFMGLTYMLLPKLGFTLHATRWSRSQPYIYGAGQLMHILGLAWSGGYGVQRKVAGAAQGLDTLAQKAGMGLMGMGGLVSTIGGVIFLVIVIRALLGKNK